jgi:hypothetical protein
MNILMSYSIVIIFSNVIFLKLKARGKPGIPDNGYWILSKNKSLSSNSSKSYFKPGTEV